MTKRPSLALVYVKIRPRKACNYPNLRSFGWVSYAKVGVLYSGKLGNRSESRASDLYKKQENKKKSSYWPVQAICSYRYKTLCRVIM